MDEMLNPVWGLLVVPLHRAAEELEVGPLVVLEDGQDQVVLGREVGVEGHLGDPGLGDHPVDADGSNAVLVEQPVSGLQETPPGCGRRGSCAPHVGLVLPGLYGVRLDRRPPRLGQRPPDDLRGQ
nr:hypothetical protein [Gemmata sp. SH-PL17]